MKPFSAKLCRRLVAAGLPAVLLTLVGVTGTASAAAPAVTCGATLKSNAVLTKDLTCPNGDGVTLYRGVTLDLGGHTLSGPGTSAGTAVTLSYKGGSVVKNGTISGWAAGTAQGSWDQPRSASTLKAVTFIDAPAVYLDAVSIVGSTFTRSAVNEAQTVDASSSSFTDSPVTAQVSLRITNSTIVGGEVLGANSVTIDRSKLDGGTNGFFGWCYGGHVSITNSTVTNYPNSITSYGCDLTLSGNTFRDNPGGVLGIVEEVDSPNGGTPVIKDNVFTRSGIAITSGYTPITVSGNTFTGNTTGIYLYDPSNEFGPGLSTSAVVTGNTFTGNTSSGIRSLAKGLTLKDNVARNNGRYGIYAPAANNRGGNIASGNKLGNCVGLTCASK